MNKAGMPSSNKTGLVLKISVVLFILLALVVYKLNEYFKNEKLHATETLLRNKVVLIKTTVSSQLLQLKNTLSSYETELADTSINWVQLDPFFAIAKLDNVDRTLKVNRMLVRSNTPAERWTPAYLEKALTLNMSLQNSPILTQLFQDKTGAKFLIIRFKTSQNKELMVVGAAEYFQKYFDIGRGESSTALLVNTENLLVAHSEGDYIATQTQETRFSKKKYLLEKEEIIGTNLIAMNYILKKKIAAGIAVPWSIIGVIAGFGCILIAIVFYSLDPMERKVERYKIQERAQIYKDTLGDLMSKAPPVKLTPPLLTKPSESAALSEKQPVPLKTPKDFYAIEQIKKETPMTNAEQKPEDELAKTAAQLIVNLFQDELTQASTSTSPEADQFLSLEEEKIDLSDIEKALALDDFDSEEDVTSPSLKTLKENLTPQKISLSLLGTPISKPEFAMEKKDFKVNEFKVNIRRPEKL